MQHIVHILEMLVYGKLFSYHHKKKAVRVIFSVKVLTSSNAHRTLYSLFFQLCVRLLSLCLFIVVLFSFFHRFKHRAHGCFHCKDGVPVVCICLCSCSFLSFRSLTDQMSTIIIFHMVRKNATLNSVNCDH